MGMLLRRHRSEDKSFLVTAAESAAPKPESKPEHKKPSKPKK